MLGSEKIRLVQYIIQQLNTTMSCLNYNYIPTRQSSYYSFAYMHRTLRPLNCQAGTVRPRQNMHALLYDRTGLTLTNDCLCAIKLLLKLYT